MHHSGLRNPWRASFDRETGDLYIGDVGLNTIEEIDFAKAGTSGLDFGWAKREGTLPGPENGPQGDSLNPIWETTHSAGNYSIVGGYIYRGPISELQGHYFLADTVSQRIWSGVFDRDTDPNTFNGDNLTDFSERKAELDALIPGGGSIDYVVSFGEDNSGNLYIIDYGDGFEPTPGSGEIFLLKQASADFDEDGDVDGDDFLTWQLNSGMSSGTLLSHGDADEDEDVDADDLAIWELQYGTTTTPSVPITVPEPSTILLAFFALLGMRPCRIRYARSRSSKKKSANNIAAVQYRVL